MVDPLIKGRLKKRKRPGKTPLKAISVKKLPVLEAATPQPWASRKTFLASFLNNTRIPEPVLNTHMTCEGVVLDMESLGQTLSFAYLKRQLKQNPLNPNAIEARPFSPLGDSPNNLPPGQENFMLQKDIREYCAAGQVSSITKQIANQWMRHMLQMYDLPQMHVDTTRTTLNEQALTTLVSCAAEELRSGSYESISKKQMTDSIMQQVVENILDHCSSAPDNVTMTLASHFRDLLTTLPQTVVERDRKLISELERVQKLQIELNSSQKMVKSLENSNQKLTREIQEFQNKIQDSDLQYRDMEGVLDEAVAAEMKAGSELKELKKQMAEMKSIDETKHEMLQQSGVEARDMLEMLHQVKESKKRLEIELHEAHRDLESSNAKIRILDQTLSDAKDLLRKEKAMHRGTMITSKMIQMKFGTTKSDLSDALKRISDLESQDSAAVVEARVTAMYESKIKAMQDHLQKVQAHNKRLSIEHISQTKEHELQHSMIREMDTFMKRYQDQIEESEMCIEQLKFQKDVLKNRVLTQNSPFQDAQKNLKQQVADLTKDKFSLLEDYERKCNERDIAHANWTQTVLENEKLQQRIDAMIKVAALCRTQVRPLHREQERLANDVQKLIKTVQLEVERVNFEVESVVVHPKLTREKETQTLRIEPTQNIQIEPIPISIPVVKTQTKSKRMVKTTAAVQQIPSKVDTIVLPPASADLRVLKTKLQDIQTTFTSLKTTTLREIKAFETSNDRHSEKMLKALILYATKAAAVARVKSGATPLGETRTVPLVCKSIGVQISPPQVNEQEQVMKYLTTTDKMLQKLENKVATAATSVAVVPKETAEDMVKRRLSRSKSCNAVSSTTPSERRKKALPVGQFLTRQRSFTGQHVHQETLSTKPNDPVEKPLGPKKDSFKSLVQKHLLQQKQGEPALPTLVLTLMNIQKRIRDVSKSLDVIHGTAPDEDDDEDYELPPVVEISPSVSHGDPISRPDQVVDVYSTSNSPDQTTAGDKIPQQTAVSGSNRIEQLVKTPDAPLHTRVDATVWSAGMSAVAQGKLTSNEMGNILTATNLDSLESTMAQVLETQTPREEYMAPEVLEHETQMIDEPAMWLNPALMLKSPDRYKNVQGLMARRKKLFLERTRGHRIRFLQVIKYQQGGESTAAHSMMWLVRHIRQIIGDKCCADRAASTNHIPPMALPDYVIEWHSIHFGVKTIVNKACKDFYDTLLHHRSTNVEAETFALFLDEQLNTVDLSFYLHFRQQVLQIVGELPDDGSKATMIPLDQATQMMATAFQSQLRPHYVHVLRHFVYRCIYPALVAFEKELKGKIKERQEKRQLEQQKELIRPSIHHIGRTRSVIQLSNPAIGIDLNPGSARASQAKDDVELEHEKQALIQLEQMKGKFEQIIKSGMIDQMIEMPESFTKRLKLDIHVFIYFAVSEFRAERIRFRQMMQNQLNIHPKLSFEMYDSILRPLNLWDSQISNILFTSGVALLPKGSSALVPCDCLTQLSIKNYMNNFISRRFKT